MKAPAYWQAVTQDHSGLLPRILALLERSGARWCVIGGQAVNAYVEPLVSLDLDLAIALDDMPKLRVLLEAEFHVEEHPYTLNVSAAGSDLRVQIQRDPFYASFVERAERREVLGIPMPVAAIEDVLAGKVRAAQEPGRRPSRRQKDLADIGRLIESRPSLRERIPDDVLERLVR